MSLKRSPVSREINIFSPSLSQEYKSDGNHIDIKQQQTEKADVYN